MVPFGNWVVRNTGFAAQQTSLQISALSLRSTMTLSKSLPLFESQFVHLERGVTPGRDVGRIGGECSCKMRGTVFGTFCTHNEWGPLGAPFGSRRKRHTGSFCLTAEFLRI